MERVKEAWVFNKGEKSKLIGLLRDARVYLRDQPESCITNRVNSRIKTAERIISELEQSDGT